MEDVNKVPLGFQEGFKAGIKEAVDWLTWHYQKVDNSGNNIYLIPRDEREAQLKEWGLLPSKEKVPKRK